MKRTIFFIVTALGLSLTACGNQSGNQQAKTVEAAVIEPEVLQSPEQKTEKEEKASLRPATISKENIRPVGTQASYAWNSFDVEETKNRGIDLIFAEATIDEISMGAYMEHAADQDTPITTVSVSDVQILEGENPPESLDTVYYRGGLVSIADWDRHQEAMGRPKKSFIDYEALTPEEAENTFYSFQLEEDYDFQEGDRIVLALAYDEALGRYFIFEPTGASSFEVEDHGAETRSAGGGMVLRNLLRPEVTYTISK